MIGDEKVIASLRASVTDFARAVEHAKADALTGRIWWCECKDCTWARNYAPCWLKGKKADGGSR